MKGNDCPSCGASSGSLHELGCDIEQCPFCGMQLLSCACIFRLAGVDPDRASEMKVEDLVESLAKLDLQGRLPWDGNWPGTAECEERDLFCRWSPAYGWVRCGQDEPGATHDLNRLVLSSRWDRGLRRFVPNENMSQHEEAEHDSVP
jgi:hypothetical protein